MALGMNGNGSATSGRPRPHMRTAPNRTYSEQVTRLFGTEREEEDSSDLEGSSSHNNSDYNLYSSNGPSRNNSETPHLQPPSSSSTSSSSRSYLLTKTGIGGSSSSSSSQVPPFNRRSSDNVTTSTVYGNGFTNHRPELLGGARRVSAPSTYSTSSSSSAPPAAQKAPAAPSFRSPSISRGNGSNTGTSGTKQSHWTLWGYVLVVSVAGFAVGALRNHYTQHGQLQQELHEAMKQHNELQTQVQELELETQQSQQRAIEQERLEAELQLLNAELDETERNLSDERSKLEHRQTELERLVRAEHATGTNGVGAGASSASSSSSSAGSLRHHHYDAASAAHDPMMMMTMTTTSVNAPPVGGTVSSQDDNTAHTDTLVGRLVQTLGVEHYGLRPLHVELHLEYHHQSHPSSQLSNAKKTTIHRRYVTAQLSLLQRPITTFVFLQQVEHDLYDHIKLVVEKDDTTEVIPSADGASTPPPTWTLRSELSDRQWRHRKALGLAHVPVREIGSYQNPVLVDPTTATTTNETLGNATEGTVIPHQDNRHQYHFALTDDGDLIISTSIHRPGVFATLVHGDAVLDKLLHVPRPPPQHTSSDKNNKVQADGSGGAATHPTHNQHHHHVQHVELISIRLLSSLDDEEHNDNSFEDDYDDDYDEEEDEEDHEEEWRHDEH